MNKKSNWNEFKAILDSHGITKLYHFTDRDNLQSIINNGGLYSWADCEKKGVAIAKPGGGVLSRNLDMRDGLHHYVRTSFTRNHPMQYIAMNDGRISNPVVLEINPEIIYWADTKFADRNATKNGANVGGDLEDFKRIHFNSVMKRNHFDLAPEEQQYYQAEILVKNFIPLEYITNIKNFGIPIPAKPQQLQTKESYTAQISRSNPTAFIFLIDQSVSMNRKTLLYGEEMTMAEAVARIVNAQINELVLRCIKGNEIRHYYDIAVIGYGSEAYSGWKGDLEGRFFVSPQELSEHPYIKKRVIEQKMTRKGPVIKEVEKVQWIEARCDGNWTHLHIALDKTKELLDNWLQQYHDKDCYPPTIINITDGEFNGSSRDAVQQQANELKSMFTNDGNVLFFNIHITNSNNRNLVFPIVKDELMGDRYSGILYDMSSLLPTRYNPQISNMRNDADKDARHVAMAVDADMTKLIQLMDIGTPTNISQNR